MTYLYIYIYPGSFPYKRDGSGSGECCQEAGKQASFAMTASPGDVAHGLSSLEMCLKEGS